MEPTQDLSATGKVILGMISIGVATGYEIKRFVDKTTRHFHAASYGQIYPELRRLEERGLITGSPEPSGARARTVYSLTDSGRRTLEAWLESDAETTYEVRDEGMLKLFFSDSLPERRLANLRAMRERNQRKLDQLLELGPVSAVGPLGPRLTLELGIGLHEWLVRWSEAAERRLASEGEEEG
jgi:DNA-binding PadR family transcriptional regulator